MAPKYVAALMSVYLIVIALCYMPVNMEVGLSILNFIRRFVLRFVDFGIQMEFSTVTVEVETKRSLYKMLSNVL